MHIAHGLRSKFSLFCLLMLFLGCSCSAGGCFSIKSMYVDSSYPIPEGPRKKRDWGLNVASVVVPSLVVGYRNPQLVGSCLKKMNQSPKLLKHLLRFGRCLSEKTPNFSTWKNCIAEHFPWVKVSSPVSGGEVHCRSTLPCSNQLSPEDQMNFSIALASTGSLLFAYQRMTFGRSKDARKFSHIYHPAIRKAIQNAVLILENDPGNKQNPALANRASLPSLALSGGGPNGAFTAGFLHAMLSLRESALSATDITPAQKKTIHNRYRFGAVAGTSVGSLISTAIDLYFSNPTKALSSKVKSALKKCLGKAYQGNKRDLQRCALQKLIKDFAVNEWAYMCVEKGSAIPVFTGKKKNLLQLAPMKKDLIDPFMKAYSEMILNNDFLRVVTAFSLDQNLLMSLDERVCRGLSSDRLECLSSGLMASISEPAQIVAVKKIYSGLRAGGEKGAWYDGGIRSFLPAIRASNLTYGRVLAISTKRLLGSPSSYPNGFAILIGSANQAITQNGMLELAQTQLSQAQRASRRSWLTDCLRHSKKNIKPHFCGNWKKSGPHHAAPSPNCMFRSAPQGSGGVWPVFIPENIKPERLFAEGYTFDPYVMRGLFLWGQRSFLRRRRALYRWLGWAGLRDLEKNCGGKKKPKISKPSTQPKRLHWACSPKYKEAVRMLTTSVTKELRENYTDPKVPRNLKWWQAHAKKRKKLLSKNITTCSN